MNWLYEWMNWFCMWTNQNEFHSNLFDLHFQDCERFKGLRRKTSRFRRSRIIGRYVSWRNIFLRAIYFLKWILISAYHLSFHWSIKVLEEEMSLDDSSDTKKEWSRGPIKFSNDVQQTLFSAFDYTSYIPTVSTLKNATPIINKCSVYWNFLRKYISNHS